ncbi:MAG: hypothetical protein ACLTYN_09810 [Dysosmobacter welbionis]
MEIPPALLDQLPPDRREALRDVLALIPVPGISRTRTGCTASSSPGRR